MRRAVVSFFLILAGCATAEPVPVVHFVCPAFVTYTQAEQAKAARELNELLTNDPQAETPIMLRDYARERAALRACKKEGLGRVNS